MAVWLAAALGGCLPFQGAQTVRDILMAHCEESPPLFADVGVDDVPPAIEALVRRCLAKSPAERPQSARELAEQYGAALGQSIADPGALNDAEALADSEPADADPWHGTLIDRFEAWLPEQVAAMKLRGFVEGVAGTVVDSLPGLIRVRLANPAAAATAAAPAKGLWGWFRGDNSSTRAATAPETIIELYLRKRPAAGRSLVEIAVVRPVRPGESQRQRDEACEQCKTVSRELRAYMMIGR